MEVVRLRPELHLIRPAFGQAYVWREGSEITLIDTAIPGAEADFAAAFAELGFRRSNLRRIIITHGHEDHAGSAAMLRRWGDVEVIMHRDDADIVRGEQRRKDPVVTDAERPLFDRIMTGMAALPPCQVDTEVVGGDIIDFGGGAHVISTPGHTEGSIAIYLREAQVLFTGDIVANGSAGPMLGPFNTDRAQARKSMVSVAQLPAQLVCFGHGEPLLGHDGSQTWRTLGERCKAGPAAAPDPLG